MFPSLFANSSLQSLEKTVEFTDRRHAILAGNMANMDTPDYKTRDLSVDGFQESLKNAIESKSRAKADSPGLQFDVLQGVEEDGQPLSEEQATQQVFDSMRQVVYHDGSDDSIEMQVSQIAKNQSLHSMAVALMRSQFQTLKMAISESINV
ncbi:MAG: flagellar basal body rod protein FlgB [Pirellula sp.]|jgi:flagellar basal-body rod protein FlgB|nr:flagellar basal body rod protein FlgB [Planctomycetota bacterium]